MGTAEGGLIRGETLRTEWLDYAKTALESGAWLVTGYHATRLLELVDAEIKREDA